MFIPDIVIIFVIGLLVVSIIGNAVLIGQYVSDRNVWLYEEAANIQHLRQEFSRQKDRVEVTLHERRQELLQLQNRDREHQKKERQE